MSIESEAAAQAKLQAEFDKAVADTPPTPGTEFVFVIVDVPTGRTLAERRVAPPPPHRRRGPSRGD